MIAAVADTHAVLWYLFDDPRLSAAARRFMDEAAHARHRVAVSSISLAELVYLVEKGRLPAEAYTQLTRAISDQEHLFAEIAFTAAAVEAMRGVVRSDVPDMPDRMIASTAAYLDVPVISRDRRIRSAQLETIW
jgi:PIN domain nuclease of toxin-antitoxin system